MLNRDISSAQYIDPSSAEEYSKHNDIQFNQSKSFIDAHGNLIRGPVLDIGSGDGKVTAYIAKQIGEPIIGVDISEERVKLANTTHGDSKLHFIAGNAVHLSTYQGISFQQYGTIVSFNTLHHVPKSMQSSVFAQAKKLLRDDGVVLFLIPGRSPELHDAINGTALNEKWQIYFTDFDLSNVRTYETEEYYKKLCKESGYYDCSATSAVEEGGKELDWEGMKNFLKGWLPHLAHLKSKNLDVNLQNNFLDDIVNLFFTLMKKNKSDTVNPKITQNKIIAYASKAAFFQDKKLPEDKYQSTVVGSQINRKM